MKIKPLPTDILYYPNELIVNNISEKLETQSDIPFNEDRFKNIIGSLLKEFQQCLAPNDPNIGELEIFQSNGDTKE